MWHTISAVIWRTVHGHIVADTFRPKKSSSVLLCHVTTFTPFHYFTSVVTIMCKQQRC